LEHSFSIYNFIFILLNLFYSIERRKVKYARVTVYPDQSVKFVFPLRFPERNVQVFIQQQQPWIAKKLAEYSKPRAKFFHLEPGQILFFGEAYTPNFPATNRTACEDFYRKASKTYFPARVRELAAQYGFDYSRIFITGAKSRWGSCSSKRNLSFTYVLIKAPKHIVDYVILHELAHTKILDHSPRFWKLVSSICPDYKAAKAWLKKYGRELG
jgi:predicted metal-dependent hydrolase